MVVLASCSFKANQQNRQAGQVGKLDSQLEERSRQYTTAVVDILSENRQTNRYTQVALKFAKADQEIEGMPLQRIETEPLILGESTAVVALEKQIKENRELLQDRADIQAKLTETNERLIELGKLYEQEKNRSIVKRIWAWAMSTLGIGGVIALCIFFPAIIPLLLSFVGWVVGKIPKLVGLFGVVGKNVFDNVVKGVGDVRERLKQAKEAAPDRKYSPNEVLAMIDEALNRAAIDKSHVSIIEARRAATKK